MSHGHSHGQGRANGHGTPGGNGNGHGAGRGHGDRGRGHSHSHSHSHGHGAEALRAGARHQRRLALSFALIAGFFVVELVGGVVTNSLALLSDAGHMLTDVIGLGMALAAIQLANRHARRTDAGSHTFGLYRLEILAAFVNSLLLFGVAVYVVVEAVRRLGEDPEVLGVPMLVVASLGLAVNLVAFVLLREGAAESLNVRGAYLEVLADTLGSVGVIVAAVLLETFGWTWVDPVVGAGIGLWILPRTWQLGSQAVRILLQAAPAGIDLGGVQDELSGITGVVDVHDVHVWTLTSGLDTASVHLQVAPGADRNAVLTEAQTLLRDDYGIGHATVQVEEATNDCDGCPW